MAQLSTPILLVLMAFSCTLLAQNPERASAESTELREAARQVDAALAELASSTKSIAFEWVKARRAADQLDMAELGKSTRPLTVSDGITLFQTWPGSTRDIPAQQSAHVAYYAYGDLGEVGLDDAALRHLATFDGVADRLQAANQALQHSWTYITSSDDWMALFPFLSPEEAINNLPPSQQVFYTAADFKTRSVGWTLPYLDLAGAGMMVTAAFPAFDGNKLLGVASQDITLRQLSSDVLSRLARDGSIVVLVNGEGLAISASEADLESEIEQVNSETGAARLYYLEPDRLASVTQASAVASANVEMNRAVTAVLDARSGKSTGGSFLVLAGQQIQSEPVHATDWWLIRVEH